MGEKTDTSICEICKEKITDNEIEICEDCGAKYHSKCFKKAKTCLHENNHKDAPKDVEIPENEEEVFGISKKKIINIH